MKKLAFVIVAAAALAAFIARKPSPSVPDGSATYTSPSATSDNNAKPSVSPTTAAEPAPPAAPPPTITTPVEPAGVTPLASDPVAVPEKELGGDPPDVVAERRNASATDNGAATRAMPALNLVMKADREGGVHGCKEGALVLNGAGIQFSCPSDSTKNVSLALTEIKEVHKNGVEASNGHKYHFNIQNTDAEQGEKLFRDWLGQTRSSPR